MFTVLYDQEIESKIIEKEVQFMIPAAIGELSFYEIAEGKGGTFIYVDTQENY